MTIQQQLNDAKFTDDHQGEYKRWFHESGVGVSQHRTETTWASINDEGEPIEDGLELQDAIKSALEHAAWYAKQD